MQHPNGITFKPRGSSSSDAELYLYGMVDEYGEINLRKVLDALGKLHAGTTLHVHINSNGGSVFEGNAILNALRNHTGKVHTYVDGVAASMGSVLFQAGHTRTMADNALLMVHNPWVMTWGDAQQLRKDAEVLDKVRDTLLATYHARSGKPVDELKAMMDAETWMTAQEAVDMKLADDISGPVLAVNNEVLQASAHNVGLRIAAYSLPKTDPEPKPETPNDMKIALLSVALGMAEGATEEQVVARIQALQAENQELKATAERQAAEAKAARIATLVEAAIKDKKILPAAKAQWAQLAEANYEAAQAALEAIQPAGSLSGHVKPVRDTTDDTDDRSGWTYRDWANKDATGLAAMKANHPRQYEALLKAHVASK
jgi:ATP-dependent Clp endopeptidase proteolytic subunit ClpP